MVSPSTPQMRATRRATNIPKPTTCRIAKSKLASVANPSTRIAPMPKSPAGDERGRQVVGPGAVGDSWFVEPLRHDALELARRVARAAIIAAPGARRQD